MFDKYPDVVRPHQLQEMIGFGKTKSYELLKSGIIPSKKIGGNYYIRKIDIINFMNPEK